MATVDEGGRSPKQGEPSANANARVGMGTPNREQLGAVSADPGIVTRRMGLTDDEEYHYHWAADDPMRIEQLQSLGYEFVPNDKDGDADSYEDAKKMAGQIKMRTPRKEYDQRKGFLYNTINPARERAPMQTFENQAERNNVESVNTSKQSRGPFSQVANEKED